MKPHALLIALSYFAVWPAATLAQGAFHNLDFESATLPPFHEGLERVEDAVPGWTFLHGTNVQSGIFRNGYGSGGKSGLRINETRIWPIFADQYYLSFTRDGRDLISTSIYQTDLVPAETKSLHFLVAVTYWVPGDMRVELNGADLPLAVLSSVNSSTYIVGADAAAFAGQTAELRFISRPYVEGGDIQTFMDDIEFSPLPVPEPSVVALTLVGAGGLLLASLRRRTKR